MSEHLRVTESMARYGRAIDSREFDLLDSCFTADAVSRYSSSFGDEVRGREALRVFLARAAGELDATQHLFGNFEVDVDGDEARFRCYVQAQHVRLGTPGGHLFTVGGRYENEAVRGSDGLWRMTLLVFEAQWTGGNAAVLDHMMPADAPARAV